MCIQYSLKIMNTSIRIVFKYFCKSPVFMNTFWIHFEYMSYITEINKKIQIVFLFFLSYW